MTEHALAKNGLGEAAVERIIDALLASGARFCADSFRRDALSTLSQLELKDRVRHLITVMSVHLPSSFPETAYILGELKEHWPQADDDEDEKQV